MRTINADDVLSIIDDLRDRMTIEGYWSVVERVKALREAQPVDKDIDAPVKDCISRQMLLEYIHGEPVGKLLCDKYNLDGLIEQFPSAQPEPCEDAVSRKDVLDDCDTCKHGYFGDSHCDNCRVRYPSHYERRTE